MMFIRYIRALNKIQCFSIVSLNCDCILKGTISLRVTKNEVTKNRRVKKTCALRNENETLCVKRKSY